MYIRAYIYENRYIYAECICMYLCCLVRCYVCVKYVLSDNSTDI